jgi:hypothetical protein
MIANCYDPTLIPKPKTFHIQTISGNSKGPLITPGSAKIFARALRWQFPGSLFLRNNLTEVLQYGG